MLLWVSRILSWSILALGAYAAVFSILTVCRYHSPGLMSDQWDLAGKLMRAGGKLSFSDFWAQHNEHRIPIGWALGLLDLRVFGGRNISLLVEIFLVQAMAAVLFIGMFRKFGAGRASTLTVSGIALFAAFSPLQMENFVWGFQVAFVMAALLGPAAFAGAILHSARTAGSGSWISLPLALSIAAAFAAECTLAGGLVAWPLLIVLGYVLRLPTKSQILVGSAAAVAVGVYLIGYHSPSHHANPWESIQHPTVVARYILTYFGSTWDASLPSESTLPTVSEVLTGLALLFALSSAGRLLWQRARGVDRLRCFLAANMLFALAIGVMTSLGRVNFGLEQAASSRYQTVALVFWASLAGTLLLSLADGRRRQIATVACQSVLAALLVVAGQQYGDMRDFAASWRTGIADGYAALANPQADQEPLTFLYPEPSIVEWYAYLRSQKLGPDPNEVARSASDRPAQ